MFYVKQNESDSVRRRVPIYLVDVVDGYTPKTGVVTPTIKVIKNGDPAITASGSFGETGDGTYYYILGTGEVDTLGWVRVLIVRSNDVNLNTRAYNAIVYITAADPLDQLGGAFVSGKVSASPNATIFAADSGTGLITTNGFYNGSVLAFTSGNLKGVARRIVDYTGITRTFNFAGGPFPQDPVAGNTFVILGRIE